MKVRLAVRLPKQSTRCSSDDTHPTGNLTSHPSAGGVLSYLDSSPGISSNNLAAGLNIEFGI